MGECYDIYTIPLRAFSFFFRSYSSGDSDTKPSRVKSQKQKDSQKRSASSARDGSKSGSASKTGRQSSSSRDEFDDDKEEKKKKGKCLIL